MFLNKDKYGLIHKNGNLPHPVSKQKGKYLGIIQHIIFFAFQDINRSFHMEKVFEQHSGYDPPPNSV